MVLREITIDNSVKYVPKTEKDVKQKTTKNRNQSVKIKPVSEGGKLNKKFSKIYKKFVKDFTAGGFGMLTK